MNRRFSYGLAGGLLSFGAPIGLLALRLAQHRSAGLSLRRAKDEIVADEPAYGYVALATAFVFAMFGYLLGRRADELARLADTDPVTGLENARGLRRTLSHELNRVARYGTPLSLLLIDLDNLKLINDRYGHRGGEQSLRHVADAIRSELRVLDVGARWGGDEFAVVAPNTPAAAGQAMAERIRVLVSSTLLPWQVTSSIGVVTVDGAGPDGQVDTEQVMHAADAALYRAKRRGRNCVEVAGTLRCGTSPRREPRDDQAAAAKPRVSSASPSTSSTEATG